MRMAEIPEQGAPGPGVHLIPAAEEVLLLADRQEQRPEAEEAAPPLPGVLPQEVPPEEPAQEAVQGVPQEAAPEELLLPGPEVIIMKQDVLPPADMAEDAEVRISGRSRLAA